MRHRVSGRKLGRKTNHRKAMWRNMAVSLFTHRQITTTLPKAKSVQPFVEKLITLAKRGDLAARRQAMSMLGEDRLVVKDEDDVPRNAFGEIERKGGRKQGTRVVKHLFEEIAPAYADRDGGYTRIVKLGRHRIGDGADLCVLQLISDDDQGPQVSGSHSRRREKANRRMAFAAQLRKGGEGEPEQTSAAAAVAEQAADAAAAEAAEPDASTEAADHEAAGGEGEDRPAGDDEQGDEQKPAS